MEALQRLLRATTCCGVAAAWKLVVLHRLEPKAHHQAVPCDPHASARNLGARDLARKPKCTSFVGYRWESIRAEGALKNPVEIAPPAGHLSHLVPAFPDP